jgi:hypothetical protein
VSIGSRYFYTASPLTHRLTKKIIQFNSLTCQIYNKNKKPTAKTVGADEDTNANKFIYRLQKYYMKKKYENSLKKIPLFF